MGKGFMVWGKFRWAIASSEGSDQVGALTWQTAWANPAKVWDLFFYLDWGWVILKNGSGNRLRCGLVYCAG
jgi:hypothetical protein